MSLEARALPRVVAKKRHLSWVSLYSYFVYAFLIAPLVVVVVVSFTSSNYLDFPPPGFSLRWYERFFTHRQLMPAALLSAQIAVLTTVLSLVLGTLVSIVMVRHRIVFRPAFQGIFLAPLIVPYIILALGLFYINNTIGLRGTMASIVVAHTVVATPYVVQLISAGLYSVPSGLEEAARGLGASGLSVFRRVTLPLILPSLASAGVFAFIVSWDEFILAYFMSTADLVTLPVVIYALLWERMEPTVAAVSTILIMITFSAVVLSEVLRRGQRAR